MKLNRFLKVYLPKVSVKFVHYIYLPYIAHINQSINVTYIDGLCSFVRSLRAGVQHSLDPGAKTFISVQCVSPGRGDELVSVRVV